MSVQILSETQEKWFSAVREQLVELRAAMARFQARAEDQETVADAVRRLQEIFLLVVVGEFNSGKSVFINALLGQPVVEEGVIPTTSRIQVLRYGDSIGQHAEDEATVLITAPVPLLKEIHIVDTPGTNAIDRHHEAITTRFVPRADLVFFVTSVDRPFTESERAFMAAIREWGKKIVLVLNKIDILDKPEDLGRVETFVAESARNLLGITPVIYPLSARAALRAKQGVDGASLEASRFAALEEFIRETLDEEERIRLKLLNPLGVGERLTGRYLDGITQESEILRRDLAVVDEIEGQLGIYQEDMERGFRLRLAEVDNVLKELELRGHEFIEESVRLARVFDLVNKSRMKEEFERKVVADAPEEIERRVEGIIDWLVTSDLKQWQAVKEHLQRHQTESSSKLIGAINPQFEYDRGRLMETVGRAAQRTLETYNKREEANRMAESVQAAVANTAMLEVGAVGVGAAVALAATSTAVDITGVLAAGVLAALGFLVIPQRRRKAKRELKKKVGALRQQLMEALETQFQREVKRSVEQLREGIAPYARFVRAEARKLEEQREEFARVRDAMRAIRREVEGPRG